MTPLETVIAFMRAMEKKAYDEGLQHVADDLIYINSPDTRSLTLLFCHLTRNFKCKGNFGMLNFRQVTIELLVNASLFAIKILFLNDSLNGEFR